MGYIDVLSNRKKELGLSFDALSEKSGVPTSTLKKLLLGVTKAPEFETVFAVTHAMGLTLDDLEENDVFFSVNERNMILQFRQLDHYGQCAVRAVMDVETERIRAANMDDLTEGVRDVSAMREAIHEESPDEAGREGHGS